MNSPQDAIALARSQLGVTETGVNHVPYWDWIGRSDLQGNPWCAAFATWVMKGSGVPFPTIDTPGGFVYCPDAITYGRAHGELVNDPRNGDLAIFDWERDAIADHVGIVTAVTSSLVSTVDGNVGNRVAEVTRPRGEVLAFFRPPYGSPLISGAIPITIQPSSSDILTAMMWLARRHTMLDSVPGGGIIVARPDGAVDCFDGAGFFGSMIGKKMNAPIVGIASTPSGRGYWLLGEDGGIFCFGDAPYKGPILSYYKKWNIGLGTQSPLIGIRRGSGDKAYVIVSDNPGDTQARLYHIPNDGSLTH